MSYCSTSVKTASLARIQLCHHAAPTIGRIALDPQKQDERMLVKVNE